MFTRKFDGKETLADLQITCMDIQKIKTASLVDIEGQVAQLPDGTKKNINIVQFDPKDDMSEVHDDLKLVKKDDVDFAQMAAEGRTPIGGDMSIFIENKPETILVFGKTTLIIHSAHN